MLQIWQNGSVPHDLHFLNVEKKHVMSADRFLFLVHNRDKIDMRFVIKDFLENEVNRGSLFNIRVALFMYKVRKLAFSRVIIDDIFFALIKFILNNHVNILAHCNNRNMVISSHILNFFIALSHCEVSMSFVSDIFIVNHWKEKGVPTCASVVHFKSDI